MRNYWQSLSDKFTYLSLDEFYELENVLIDKINLINISNELNIPKETIRRKVNELQESGILAREGKSIIFNKRGMNYQKPEKESIQKLVKQLKQLYLQIKLLRHTWLK